MSLLLSVLLAMLLCVAAPGLAAGYEFPEFGQGVNQAMSSYPTEPTGIVLNDFLGADRFYDAGITGQSAIAANIEPGHIWSGHETLGHVAGFSHHSDAYGSTTSDLYDRHATWVGMLIGGRKGGAVQGDFQTGISPGVDLRSGAINMYWTGSAYSMSVNYNWNTFMTPFNAYFGTADVINCSWSGVDPTGTYVDTILVDSMVLSNPRTTYVAVAGNAGPGTNTVGWPGSGYNAITVGGLGNPNAYDSVASFSSRGPQDYSDPVNGTIAGVRAAVDISAPATNIKTAYYGGQTGGNNPSLPGSPSGIIGGADSYTIGLPGTSLAAPIITGGAALLASASYNTAGLSGNADSRDGRVVKAVLLNSAEKTFGWNNGQTSFGSGVETTQSLDYKVGAGRINLDRAYDQYLSGTTDIGGQASGNLGSVENKGWDFGLVRDGTDNDYYISTELQAGTDFSATLTWFRDRTSSGPTVYDNGQSDLDMIIFDATGGTFAGEISRSISDYNVVEHLYFTVPTTGYYGIRVHFDGTTFGSRTSEQYGLAWSSAPETEPEAVTDNYEITQNSEFFVSAENGLLANDVDADGDDLVAQLVNSVSAQHGQLWCYTDGSFIYTPDTDYLGPDFFLYRVSDGTTWDYGACYLTVVPTAAVPEPSIVLLLLTGLASLMRFTTTSPVCNERDRYD